MLSEAVGEQIRALELVDGDGEKATYKSHRELEASRREALCAAFPECGEGLVVAIVAESPAGELMEFIAVNKPPGLELVTGSCQITYEDLTPSQCVEYCFAEEPERWLAAQLSLGALEAYRGSKFEAWKAMLVSPTCEAQFRRMLHMGMITQLYDPHVFPTPEALQGKYEVTDEKTGKKIQLPHPVGGLRVWSPADMAYRVIDTQLAGAPSEGEKEAWWADFVEQLRAKHGSDYIDGLLGAGA